MSDSTTEGDRAMQLLRGLEKEILTLKEENAQLKEQLDLALRYIPMYPDSPDVGSDHPQTQPRPRAGSATEARLDDKQKGGRKVSKKLQKAYQASTNRIVSTFARHDPLVIEGTCTSTLHGHSDGVWSVCSSVIDGLDMAVSASADRTCRVWLVNSGACVVQYSGHRSSANTATLLDPGAQAAHFVGLSGGGDGAVHRWLVDRELANPRSIGMTVGVGDGQDTSQGVVLKQPDSTFVGHTAPISSLALCQDNQCVTASHDATGRLWDIPRGVSILKLPGHEQELTDVCCHPHRKFAITSSRDATFRMWDFRQSSIREVSVCQGHADAVNSTAIVSDHIVASTSEDSTLKMWDLRKMRSPLRVIRLNSPANKMAVSPTKHHLAVPTDGGSVKLYDVNTGARVGRMPKRRTGGHRRAACCVSWLSDDRLISASFDHTLMVWQLRAYERHDKLPRLGHRRQREAAATTTTTSTSPAPATTAAATTTAAMAVGSGSNGNGHSSGNASSHNNGVSSNAANSNNNSTNGNAASHGSGGPPDHASAATTTV
ncbi:hypothetical protein PTSG_08234 [Salpingoeca rosetta]|uniref:Uncharacterized protein n=1 Tax=Salpingoeca rosetta (strain ATCC 50818 / BSB-021) TaxID=946362 RepID=F2UID8_SALR5|nr:uncharacterized protein PTSG_08234 [Salpingoeca rosetta]EGD76887.1 hypothetical protein PTSG_08234 [Salpingoeca rosetta]|eukprot:XP_004991259.1 hypothetical protein PTSG_08234 [Salpingoeca rosetta]